MLQPTRAAQGPCASLPTRLFVHGFTGAPASWDGVCAHLGDDRAHVAMRVLGHHPEVPARQVVAEPHAAEAFDQVIKAMCTALDELPNRHFHLIGYSLGARLALGMLLHAPERFAHATLLGGHPGLQSLSARTARTQTDALWEQMLREAGMSVFLKHWLQQPLFARLAELPPDRLAADAALRERHAGGALADALAATSLARMPSHWAALGHVERSVCFAAGAEDEKFCSLLQAASACTPHSTLQVIPGAGHNVLLEAPSLVARLILAMEKRV